MKIVVIGGGVIGLFAAYYCAQRGWDVTVVERNGEARDGCSYQNTGMVVPSHFVPLAAPGMVGLALKWMLNPASPFYVKPRPSLELISWGLKFWRASSEEQVRRAAPVLRDLALASRKLYEEGGFELEPRGLLALCKTEHALDEEAHAAELARELGLSAEVLDAKQTAAREPGVRMDVAGSVYYPQDSNLAPDKLMATLQKRAGARFVWNTEVVGFAGTGSHIDSVQTADGQALHADKFLLCAGSWSPQLAARLGLDLPMQPGKGYSVTLPKPKQSPKQCAILSEARVAVSPLNGSLRFGGTMELAGLNEDINPIRVKGIVDAARRYYPEFTEEDFAGLKPWRGLRPCSPDGLPYIGQTRVSNLVVATGHAMLGITLGPITGKLCSEIIAGEKPSADLKLLSPERFL